LIGSTLAHFRITAKLGAGGMGEVYRATDTKLGREVAIKVLPPAFTRDAERLARFAREAQVLASLNHPNIATIHGLEESDGARALVLELVEGPTFADRLAQGPLPLDDALAAFLQIAAALEYAHAKGIVHRDLKPANVKVTPSGNVKILDFGLAKAVAAESSAVTATALAHSPTITHSTTTPGVMLGTAAYMAPEQAKGQPVDERADIWAFGVVLYEALTGTRLFAGETVPDTLAHILTREPDLARLPEATPARIRNLLRRCLTRDPRHRLQAIGDARVVLEEVIAHPEVDSSAVGSFVPRAARAGRRERLAWAAAAAAALAAGWLLRAALPAAPPAAPPIRATIDLQEGTVLNYLDHSVALSPDGSLLALVAFSTEDLTPRLYLRALDALQLDLVPGTEGASHPFWAPDSRALGFFAGGKLKRLDLPGKVVRTLCDAPSGRGASWSSRGLIAFAPARSGGLLQVPAAGGAPTPLTTLRRPLVSHRLPHFLPDGRHLLYSVIRGDAAAQGVWLFDLDERREKRLLPVASDTQFVAPGYLAFVREDSLMLQSFDVDRAGTTGAAISLIENVHRNLGNPTSNVSFSPTGRLVYQLAGRGRQRLVWIGRDGERLAAAAEVSGLTDLSLSPDGRQAVLKRVDERNAQRLFLLDLERGVQSAVTAEVTVDSEVVWSPDGHEIAYNDFSGPGYRVRRQNLARGEPPRTVLDDPTHDFHPSGWSPDGKTLVLWRVALRGAQTDVVTLELGGERRLRPLVAGPAAELAGQVSPQGRWLSFFSNESGRLELYVVSFPVPGRRWPITSGGAFGMEWLSEDEIVYFAADGRVVRVTLALRGDRLEVGPPHRVFGDLNLNAPNVVRADVDVASGRLLVVEQVGRPGGGALVLISDWRSELARR
jgi:Tol biopolymer transport system component/tRNA A-37 threonylcarbamoyl transferase component Bud32